MAQGNIIITDSDTVVVLHTDTIGEELEKRLQNAMYKGNGRHRDTPYFTRVVFCEMIKDDVLGLDNFSISASPIGDSSFDILVDIEGQQVILPNSKPVSFDEYMKTVLV